MRALTLSLLATVIAATIGLGILINWVYGKVASDNNHLEENPIEEYAEYIKLSQQIAYLVDSHLFSHEEAAGHNLQEFIEIWNAYPNTQINLDDMDSLALPEILAKKFQQGETIILEDKSNILFYTRLQSRQKILLLEIPSTSRAPTYTAKVLFTLLFYLGIILSIILWILPLLRHLQLLDATAKQFGKGDLDSRIPIKRFSYIKGIERVFNAMATQIQELIADNRLLSRAVSHDLKTPLSRLRFGLDTLAEEERADKRELYHQRLDADLNHMESLINTLLEYARLEDTHLSITFKTINFSSYLTQYIHEFAQRAEVKIIYDEIAQADIKANQHYLNMLLQNLLTNAEKYAKSTIKVTLRALEKQALLIVEDDGPGVPKEDTDRIFKPFQKSIEAAQHRTSSHGMGLAICARTTQWLSGTIKVEQSQQFGGAKFLVSLPLVIT